MFGKILQIAIPFIWFGFVCAISFMEAPLKFQAPNITIPLGLGIGYLVFHMLNKVEMVLCGLFLLTYLFSRTLNKTALFIYVIIAAILIVQTFVLFPLLDERTARVINGTAEPFSNLHIVYIVSDSIKILLLLGLGGLTAKQHIKI